MYLLLDKETKKKSEKFLLTSEVKSEKSFTLRKYMKLLSVKSMQYAWEVSEHFNKGFVHSLSCLSYT